MIVVVGSGPAGLAAALAAAERDEVTIVDQSPRFGGQYWRHAKGGTSFDPRAQEYFSKVLEHPRIIRKSSSRVWHGEKKGELFYLYVLTDGVESCIEANEVILATGAYDRTIPFNGWTLPGVVTAGGAQAMLKANKVLIGKKIVIAGTGPFLLPVSLNLIKAGAEVRTFDSTPLWRWIFNLHGLLLHPSKIKEARFYRANVKIEKGILDSYREGYAKINKSEIACDALAIGWGFTPDVSLASIFGAQLVTDLDGSAIVKVNSHQMTSIPHLYAAGEITGVGGADLAITEGEIAGRGKSSLKLSWNRLRGRIFARGLQRVYKVPNRWQTDINRSTHICRCEKVSAGDIRKAVEELGALDSRGVKLFTRAGMGFCQGRVCARNVSDYVAHVRGSTPTEDELIAGARRPVAQPISLGELGDGLNKGF